MAQSVNMLVAGSDTRVQPHGTHVVEGENQQVVLWPHP